MGWDIVSQKVYFSGSNLTCKSGKLVDQSSRGLFPRKQEESVWIHLLLWFGYLKPFGDIRGQSQTLQKIDGNFACFWPLKFFRGGPPSCPTLASDCRQIAIMWQSFAAIGRGTSEIWLPKEKNICGKSPSGTTVPGGLIIYFCLVLCSHHCIVLWCTFSEMLQF